MTLKDLKRELRRYGEAFDDREIIVLLGRERHGVKHTTVIRLDNVLMHTGFLHNELALLAKPESEFLPDDET